jgi:hypothetical protein
VLNQGSAEKDAGEKGHNAKQVVLKQHANKGRNANRVDINGNRTLELAREQLEEDGRKTETARKRTKNWNRTKIAKGQWSRN